MATRKPKAPVAPTLDNEARFIISDSITAQIRKTNPTLVVTASTRNKYFRDIVMKLEAKYDNDTAVHITNLVLRNLSTVELNFDLEV